MQSTAVGHFPKVGDSREEQELRRATEDLQKNKITPEAFGRIEEKFTALAIEEQISAGIDLITDGQIRWVDPVTWPALRLDGIKATGLIRFFDNNVYYRQPVIQGAIGWSRPLVVDDFRFAQKLTGTRAKLKAVLPGPYTLARLSKDEHYGNLEDVVTDFAKALNHEVRELQKAGASFIQIDEPSLPLHPEDFRLAQEGIEIALASLSGVKTAMYTYFTGISKVFANLGTLPVDLIGVDLVSDPENLALLQKNKFPKPLALGIVDARNTRIEKEETVRRLMASLSKNAEQIQYVNPSAGLEFLPRAIAVEKLKLVGRLTNRIKETV